MGHEYVIEFSDAQSMDVLNELKQSVFNNGSSDQSVDLRDPASECGWHYDARFVYENTRELFFLVNSLTQSLGEDIYKVLQRHGCSIVEDGDSEPLSLRNALNLDSASASRKQASHG